MASNKPIGTKKMQIQGLGTIKSKTKIHNETIVETSSRNLNSSQSKTKLITSESKPYNHLTSINVRFINIKLFRIYKNLQCLLFHHRVRELTLIK